MKKNVLTYAFACLTASAGLCLVSCETEDPQTETPGAPVLTITTDDNMQIPAAGDDACKISYTIENAVEGGTVSASAENAEWLGDFSAADGTVTFSADANDSGEDRNAKVTVVYTYNGSETVSDEITVEQPAVPAPVITLVADKTQFEYTGGEASYTYTLANPVSGAELSLDAPDWVTDVQISSAEPYTVTFKVSENISYDERADYVSLVYSAGSETLAKSDNIVIRQSGAPAPDPVISFTIEGKTEFDAKGGNTTFYYSIDYPVDGAALSYVLKPAGTDWITDMEITTELPLTVKFTIAANTDSDPRSATIQLQYKSGDEVLAELPIEISQEGATSGSDAVEFAATSMSIEFMPGFPPFMPNTANLTFGNDEGSITIYMSVADDAGSAEAIPTGEYAYSYGCTTAGYWGSDGGYEFDSYLTVGGTNTYFNGGTFSLTNNGGGSFTVDALLETADGTHHLTFSGTATF